MTIASIQDQVAVQVANCIYMILHSQMEANLRYWQALVVVWVADFLYKSGMLQVGEPGEEVVYKQQKQLEVF